MSAEHLPHRAGSVRGESPDGLAAVLNLPGRVRSPHRTEHLAGMGSKGSNTASEVVRLPSDSGFAEFSDLAELVDLAESLEPGRFRDIDDRDLTVLILAEHHVPGLGWFSRALGINAALSVADTVRSILLSLEWPGAATMLTPESGCTGHGRITTWSLQTRREDRLRVYSRTAGSIATPLYEALGSDGTGVLTVDGYTVMVTTTGAVPRDGHTPEAVCLAGTFAPDNPDSPDNSGKSDSLSIPAPGVVDHPVGLPRDVDLAAVNVALTGEETVAEILDGLAPELRSLLLAGDLFEFTPLLQALDLGRPAQISAATRQVLETFPVETSRIGRAAAWSRVVALSTLSDRSAADEVTAMLMTALGFVRADADLGPSAGRLSGDPLDATEIRALSQQSGHLLAMCGADVWEDRDDPTWGDSSPIDGPAAVIPLVPKRSLVDRLEMYRFLLQDRKT